MSPKQLHNHDNITPKREFKNIINKQQNKPESFIIVPYEPDSNNILFPQIPLYGPCNINDENQCRIGIHHLRDRKTGPCFLLTVIQCHKHNKFFTLYPPGYAPYGRKTLAPVAPDGSLLDYDNTGAGLGFENTFFDTALDAQKGIAWSRPDWNSGGKDKYWSTQCRQLKKVMCLTGVLETQTDINRNIIADILGIQTAFLHWQADEILKNPGYRKRGECACNILESMQISPSVTDKLLSSGYYSGLWGRPYYWDKKTKVLKFLSSFEDSYIS